MKKILFGLLGLTLATSALANPVELPEERASAVISGKFAVTADTTDSGISLNMDTLTFNPKSEVVVIPESATTLEAVNEILDRAFDPYDVKVLYTNGKERPTNTFQVAVTTLTADPTSRFFTLGDDTDIAKRANVVYNENITEGSKSAGGIVLGMTHSPDVNNLTIKVAGDYKYLQTGKAVVPGNYKISGRVWAKVMPQ